jgi:hypothetical protein
MKTRKGRRWGATVFRGEEVEEARRVHDVGGDNTVKSGAVAGKVEGDDRRLEVEDDQRKLGRMVECAVVSNC